MNIILMNGYVCCLKTTISYYLSANLEYALISNSFLGDFISDRTAEDFHTLRQKRYSLARKIAKKYLELGISIVLDGNYPRKKNRELVYDLTSKRNDINIIAITCKCSETSLIKKRFSFRKRSEIGADSNSENFIAFIQSREEYEEITEKEISKYKISKIEFDSCSFETQIKSARSDEVYRIHDFIVTLIEKGYFENPFFVDAKI